MKLHMFLGTVRKKINKMFFSCPKHHLFVGPGLWPLSLALRPMRRCVWPSNSDRSTQLQATNKTFEALCVLTSFVCWFCNFCLLICFCLETRLFENWKKLLGQNMWYCIYIYLWYNIIILINYCIYTWDNTALNETAGCSHCFGRPGSLDSWLPRSHGTSLRGCTLQTWQKSWWKIAIAKKKVIMKCLIDSSAPHQDWSLDFQVPANMQTGCIQPSHLQAPMCTHSTDFSLVAGPLVCFHYSCSYNEVKNMISVTHHLFQLFETI